MRKIFFKTSKKREAIWRRLAFLVMIILSFYACQDEEQKPVTIPDVTTTAPSSIEAVSARSGGNIVNDGGGSITARGVVWSTSNNPTISLSTKTVDGTGSGSFSSSLVGLLPNTKYFLRAYATNSAGTAYGDEFEFTTLANLPSLTTISVTGITSTSASAGGNITNDGGSEIVQKGVVWSTNRNPTVALSTKTQEGTGLGSFTSSLTNLSPGTKYYVRAYATNPTGTAYGDEIEFTTLTILPTVTTKSISSIIYATALAGGTITNDGGGEITARGVVWSTNVNPTVTLGTKTTNGTGTGSFESQLTNLLPSTKYYVRAYATNSAGTAYGDEVSFTSSPSVVSIPPSSLNLDPFYKKYIDASGIPIISSDKVPDMALYNAHRTITKMISLRSDILEKMIENKHRVGIMAKTEVTTDMPEHSDLDAAFPGRNWDQFRGLGATTARPLSTGAEENVLCYGLGNDPYFNEDILIHEFAHGFHLLGIRFVDPNIDTELQQALDNAISKGLWLNTYAASNIFEYFAEGVQCWFNINAEAIPTNGIHNQVNTREELKSYDITLYNILKRYFPEDNEKISCHQ
jgi:hypothetical protein